MLVDALNTGSDPQTFTGSHNWSVSADTKNDENVLVVHDAFVTNQYYQSLCKNFTDLGGAACSMVGVEKFDFTEYPVAVYPNPGTDFITVKVKNTTEKLKVNISNCLGKIMMQKEILAGDEISFDVSGLDAGIYFVTILRGDRNFTEKFIRQ